MTRQTSSVRIARVLDEPLIREADEQTGAGEVMSPLAIRVHAEYREMPGLRLTVRQAARLFGVAHNIAEAVLHELRRASILVHSDDGTFSTSGDWRR